MDVDGKRCQFRVFSTVLTNYQRQLKPIMIPKFTLIIFLASGLAVAVLVTVYPDITGYFINPYRLLIGTRQIPFLSAVSRSLSGSGAPPFADKFGTCAYANSELHKEIKRHRTSVRPVTSAANSDSARASRARDTNGEAVAALHLALDMVDHHKYEKAIKLFQHALALDPEHPDILNEYGEFLERSQRDIVTAEHMYCRALILSPSHSRALANRERTLPLVEEIDETYFNSLDLKRDMLVKIPDSDPSLRRMKKESYFKHIYHTTAIEGNTFTLMQTRSLVETGMAIGGKSILEHNEILGMDAALSFINSSLVQRIGAITIKDIQDIHRRVLGFVDPIGAGEFRTTQVFVGDFMPPKPQEVEYLMEDFVQWLNSDGALSLHPIEMAALTHYKLVFIHPFYDGNGRTSRLLMNLILMQAGYPPIIIKVEEKHEYYQHLQTANDGDIRPFIRFIARCTERTLDDYIFVTEEYVNFGLPGLAGQQDDGKTIIIENNDIGDEI